MTQSDDTTRVAVIGATGNIGRKTVELLLTKLHISHRRLELYASQASAGQLLIIAGHQFEIRPAEECDFKKVKICFLATAREISARYIPLALKNKTYIIDSSSLCRQDEHVPLVVMPVNKELVSIAEHRLYAIANCIASPASIVLASLHKALSIRRISMVTYQSTSGAGKLAMDELESETNHLLSHQIFQNSCFPRQIAFNVIPMIDGLLDNGYTQEEIKIISEIKKILSADLSITTMCVRVPVMIGHSISLGIEFHDKFDLTHVKQLLSTSSAISIDDEDYTTPVEAVDTDSVHVGRIHRDMSVANGLQLWLCSDNLRRGGATDAVEVIEEILRQLHNIT